VEHSNRQISAPAGQVSDFLREKSAIVDKPGIDTQSHRVLLVFQLSDRLAAVRLEDVERITPMAELATPPGLPAALEGVLNLAGVAIPVLRLDRLFGLPAQQLGLYSMLVILKAPREGTVAILVDRVREVLPVPENAFVPIRQEDSLNGCAEATVTLRDGDVHLLSPPRILLAKERETLAEFQAMAQRRLRDWETSQS
jgi:purine-binding chemotaxis protein CheW